MKYFAAELSVLSLLLSSFVMSIITTEQNYIFTVDDSNCWIWH